MTDVPSDTADTAVAVGPGPARLPKDLSTFEAFRRLTVAIATAAEAGVEDGTLKDVPELTPEELEEIKVAPLAPYKNLVASFCAISEPGAPEPSAKDLFKKFAAALCAAKPVLIATADRDPAESAYLRGLDGRVKPAIKEACDAMRKTGVPLPE